MNTVLEVIKNNKGIIKKVAFGVIAIMGVNMLALAVRGTTAPGDETIEVEPTLVTESDSE